METKSEFQIRRNTPVYGENTGVFTSQQGSTARKIRTTFRAIAHDDSTNGNLLLDMGTMHDMERARTNETTAWKAYGVSNHRREGFIDKKDEMVQGNEKAEAGIA